MPYIPREDRERAEKTPWTPGELTFAITRLILGYRGRKGESYTTYNDIIGSLEATKLEMYRRQVSKYEDKKKRLNGEVYFRGVDDDETC